jgi:hypothetical protein
VDADLLDRGGRFRLEAADLLCYAHGFYFALGQRLGRFGWSVRKKPAKRLSREKRARKG